MRPGFVKVQVMLGLVAVILITSALITHNTVLYNKSFKRCHPLREGILVFSLTQLLQLCNEEPVSEPMLTAATRALQAPIWLNAVTSSYRGRMVSLFI